MARAKERLDLALTGSRLALWDWDLTNNKVYFNESWSSLLGAAPRESTFSGDEVLGWNHPEDRDVFLAALGNATKGVSEEFDCEYRVPNATGEWVWIHSRGKVTQRDERGRALRMTGTSTNVTKRKRAEERAEYLATRDPLTGLPNRVLLHDRLEQAVVNAARHHTGFAFMFIDLDRFKTINDSLGHQVGDELLKRVAARLTACVRATDTVARLGGDEFAVILENLEDDDDEGAQQVAEKMIAAMGAPMLIDNQHLSTSCSIGISLYPADGKRQRGADEERRRRDVLRQGEGAQQLPVLLRGDERARAGAAVGGELPAARAEAERAGAALPAAREDARPASWSASRR